VIENNKLDIFCLIQLLNDPTDIRMKKARKRILKSIWDNGYNESIWMAFENSNNKIYILNHSFLKLINL